MDTILLKPPLHCTIVSMDTIIQLNFSLQQSSIFILIDEQVINLNVITGLIPNTNSFIRGDVDKAAVLFASLVSTPAEQITGYILKPA